MISRKSHKSVVLSCPKTTLYSRMKLPFSARICWDTGTGAPEFAAELTLTDIKSTLAFARTFVKTTAVSECSFSRSITGTTIGMALTLRASEPFLGSSNPSFLNIASGG